MRDRIVYKDTCELFCTDKDRTEMAELLNFVPGKLLTVSIHRSIKISLRYDEKHKQYVGSAAGLEFISKGPDPLK